MNTSTKLDHGTPISSPCSEAGQVEKFDEAMKLLGDFWTLRIVDALSTNELRFCGIERAIAPCNPVTLSNRLKKLEDAGFIARKVETVDKQSVAYALTDKGHGILDVLNAIRVFTDTYL